METIEERAAEYIKKSDNGEDIWRYKSEYVANAFIDGAKSERELLTKWNNPEKDIPRDFKMLLLKTKSTIGDRESYVIGYHCDNNYYSTTGICNARIIGWREIHE